MNKAELLDTFAFKVSDEYDRIVLERDGVYYEVKEVRRGSTDKCNDTVVLRMGKPVEFTGTCPHYLATKEVKKISPTIQAYVLAKTGKLVEYETVYRANCAGSREFEECNCGGDRSRCTVYPSARSKDAT